MSTHSCAALIVDEVVRTGHLARLRFDFEDDLLAMAAAEEPTT